MTGAGRFGGRAGPNPRPEHDVHELRERALYVGGSGDEPLRRAAQDLASFFSRMKAHRTKRRESDEPKGEAK